jgi:hypothetical protein
MINVAIRSSLINSWEFCENKCFLEYVLNIPQKPKGAADLGNVFHKAAELLNKRKLCIQNGLKTFKEGDGGNEFTVSQVNPEFAAKWAFDYYTTKTKGIHNWGKTEFRDLTSWMDTLLSSDYSPEKLDIHGVEHFFDFEIKEDWAKYKFEVKGKIIEGYLRIRGTFDLLIQHGPDTLEYVDYKTGRPFYDWGKKETKTVESLHYDNQLLIYYYALRRIYSKFPHLWMTLFYLKKEGGSLPCCFGPEEYKRAEAMIKRVFAETVACKVPAWIYYDANLNSNCRFCDYNKETHPVSNKTLCKHYRDEVIKLGMDKVVNQHVDLSKFGQYTGGGTERKIEQ